MSQYQLNTQSKIADDYIGKFLTPFQRRLLQKRLQEVLLDSHRQRIEIMLLADQGKSQTAICQILGCCPATARYWMHIARAGMAHQWQDCPIGRPKAVNEKYLERLKELISHSPRDYGYSFRRWTASWLQKHLAKELGIEVSDRHIKRLLKNMGLSTITKKNKLLETADKNANQSSISIDDLKLENISEPDDFLSVYSDKLGI
uniref:Translposase n=1 Tax=Nostoc sp. PCC 9201 TaxID=2099382 RepID=A0A2P0ZGT7_9NOSO|nr:translposase [Nostoc sp. PCC 9201]